MTTFQIPSFHNSKLSTINDLMNLRIKKEDTHVPPVNIIENDSHYVLTMAVPGLEKDKFKISIEKYLMTISYEEKQESDSEVAGKVYLKEYQVHSFSRSFHLSDNINQDEIIAEYKNGELILTVPKLEIKNQIRSIEIN